MAYQQLAKTGRKRESTHRLITLRITQTSAARNDHEYCNVKKTAQAATAETTETA